MSVRSHNLRPTDRVGLDPRDEVAVAALSAEDEEMIRHPEKWIPMQENNLAIDREYFLQQRESPFDYESEDSDRFCFGDLVLLGAGLTVFAYDSARSFVRRVGTGLGYVTNTFRPF